MTEVQWRTVPDPAKMFAEFALCEHQRKTRLFLVAHARAAWELLSDASKSAVEVAEQFADGEATDADLAQAEATALAEATARDKQLKSTEQHLQMGNMPEPFGLPKSVVAKLQGDVDGFKAKVAAAQFAFAATFAHYSVMDTFAWELTPATKEHDAALIRDIYGNPFRPVTFNRAWRSETVVTLAKGMYAENRLENIKALGLALQAAGCEHPDVLATCRADGPHVRGNWVVDLILGHE